jgi:hypothetical protein
VGAEHGFSPHEGLRRDFMIAVGLAPQYDDSGLCFIEAIGAFAMLDNVDRAGQHSFLECHRFVHHPLELTIHFSGDGQNRDFADGRTEAGLEPEIAVKSLQVLDRLGTVELIPAGPCKPATERPGVAAWSYAFLPISSNSSRASNGNRNCGSMSEGMADLEETDVGS